MKQNKKKWFGIAIGGLAAFAVLIQLVPVSRTNPPVTQSIVWDSPQTQQLAARACMDCHSNTTVWPWYAYVAPVSWLVVNDTNQGRRELNFSEWDKVIANRKTRLVRNVEESISNGSMPDPKYYPTHPTARLTDVEKQQLIDGLKVSMMK